MLNDILQEAKQEIKFGYLKKKHPFRYPSLASLTKDFPNQRTVVLRDTTTDFELIFYTDERSNKIEDFIHNPNASVLFYHPKKLLQIKVMGKMKIVTSGKVYEEYWSKIQGKSRKDFITEKAPGTQLKNPDDVEFLDDKHHFCLLKLVPTEIEYLQLKRPHHIRALFSANDNWEGKFLNP
ncbi:pyridoxamine 5'-phosphate oxidase family protein [Psychroflexus planctonicus]|uniref:Pyridoxamine 5'-phosphate oxidase Alr4036 family FMN-binding domain-containing protein n=1 Tax=Psychroflexus planctonicus TaxID=1526575 RepID=A0ABQ1SK14_9FLAO|nr:pyridoxamine 5'-phosphate oxidase family protein [Psychroflexus planctonicus]GGE39082.1 hypothetical protein GCM10010832_19200 [Psychroflexus planctonicus]